MKTKYIICSAMLILSMNILVGCGDDDKDSSIVVEDLNGNVVAQVDGDQGVENTLGIEVTDNIGPAGSVVEGVGSEEVSEMPGGPGEVSQESSGPSSPAEDPSLVSSDDVTSPSEPGETTSEGPGNDVASTTQAASPENASSSGADNSQDGPGGLGGVSTDSVPGDGPTGSSEVVGDPGSPYDAVDATSAGGPEGNVVEAPSFASSSISADAVVSRAGKYVSLGSGDEAPDGSRVWSASGGNYSVDIQADSNNKVYSAFFSSSSGDKAYLADCVGAFDAGAQAFVNSNEEGRYESNGMIFELEAKGGEMCSIRVTSSSYQATLGNPQ